jgi:hypothetical protein
MVQDYGFRVYSPALAKFLSVDPLSSSYPYYTPYQFAGNMPIIAIDVDGAEPLFMFRFNTAPAPVLRPSTPTASGTPGTGTSTSPVPAPGVNVPRYDMPTPQAQQDALNLYNTRYQEKFGNQRFFVPTGYDVMADDNFDFGTTKKIRKPTPSANPMFDHVLVWDEGAFGPYDEKLNDALLESIRRGGGNEKIEKDENTSGFTAYITIRDQKKQLKIVNRPLFYAGVFSAYRYNPSDIERRNMEIVGGDKEKGTLTKAMAYGIEQILIELNNGGKPYPKDSKTLDNLKNNVTIGSPTYWYRKIVATKWLNEHVPNWQTEYYRPNVQNNTDKPAKKK